MTILKLISTIVLCLILWVPAMAEEVVYVSKAAIYHRGDIAPGRLDPEKLFIALTPRANVKNLGVYVELRASANGKQKKIGFFSCEQISKDARGPAEITNVYGLISCNPLTAPDGSNNVILPPGAQLVAAVRTSSLEFELPTAGYKIQTASSNPASCSDIVSGEKPTAGKKRLRIDVFAYRRSTVTDYDVVVGRDICLQVTPVGAVISKATIHGFLYQYNSKGQNKLVSAFNCELNGLKELPEGKKVVTSLSSCNFSPGKRKLDRGAKLGIELSPVFTAVPKLIEDDAFDVVVPVRTIEP